jgi:plasmid replication initiation protein
MRRKKEENFIKTATEKIAYKDNQLTQVSGKVINRDPCTEVQAKIITYLAAMVKKEHTINTIYSVDVSEFIKMMGTDELGGSQYNIIKKSLINFRKLGIDIETFDDSGIRHVKGFPFIYEYNYNVKEGKITFQLHEELIKLYSNYDYRFTMIDVATIMRLRGKYTIPLYEFLLSWCGAKTVTCTTEQLRKILSVPAEKYAKVRSFFEWCVYPAVEEINDKATIKVKIVPVEIYRRQIQKLEFEISPNTPTEKLEQPLTEMEVLLIETGIKTEAARKIVESYSEKRIEGNFSLTKEAKIAGLVKNFSAFLIKAIKEDYAHIEIGDLFGDQIVAEEKERRKKEQDALKTAIEKMHEEDTKKMKKENSDDPSIIAFVKNFADKYPWLSEIIIKKEN